MKSRFQTRKRVLSLILVLVMLIGLMPQTALNVEAADHTGGTIYFQKPTDPNWQGNVVQLAIGKDSYTDVYEMKQVNETDWYTCEIPSWGGATYCAVITNGNLWGSGNWGPSNLSNAQHYAVVYDENYTFNSGSYYYLVPSSSDNGAELSITYKPVDLFKGPFIIAGNGSGNWLNSENWNVDASQTSNHMELGSDNVWRITYENVNAGSYQFKFATNKGWDLAWGGVSAQNGVKTQANQGSSDNITFAVENDNSNVTIELELGLSDDISKPYFTVTVEEAPAPVERNVKLHFKDTMNWGKVYGYAWYTSPREEINGIWPGTPLEKDSDGYYTMDLTLDSVTKSLSYIFNNGSDEQQTIDLKIDAGNENVELYVQPDGGIIDNKYNCTVSPTPIVTPVSPEVNGNSVTFRYQGGANALYVAGTFNDWTQVAMQNIGDDWWEVTINDIEPGSYQYKFVCDGNWESDPLNYATISKDNNSFFVVPGASREPGENEIKVEVTYNRGDKNYDNWNAYSWASNTAGSQGDFTINEKTNEGVTTFYYPARINTSVTVAVRKGEWDAKACEEKINTSDILSGTIYVYVSTKDGQDHFSYVLGTDVVRGNKVLSGNVDYDNNQFIVKTQLAGEIALYKDGEQITDGVTITSEDTVHTIQLTDINLKELHRYSVRIVDDTYEQDYKIYVYNAYSSKAFENEYTYNGDDLGATWSETSTTFKVWAPTATEVKVARYTEGTAGVNDLIEEVPMTEGEKGVWSVTVDGDLNETYYTYKVTVGGETIEACDPYARTTGVNGKRAMVLNLDATDPEDWNSDKNPHEGMNYTDAIIYELHVRDFSIDESSGISNKGKYLGLTETGTTLNGTPGEISTGLDYLDELGVTHLHLLPVYDYGSVDESKLDTPQFNWGYDPVNYNVPEGSYSTNPYEGEVRVKEFKQMVQALHETDINVVMDVVYNHVYDGAQFCMNQIVPGYFSRFAEDGTYYNGTGCGNDTASEHSMVRKYIVDSVVYWAKEYHIDGFRFDLVGILDAATVTAIVKAVHEVDDEILFYGEGWQMAEYTGLTMATQQNYASTSGFAYFSDSMREMLAGKNEATTIGFSSGAVWDGMENWLYYRFKGTTDHSGGDPIPTQVVNYASCHDNYALWDKLILTTDVSEEERIKMNNLAAAIYMTSEGIPFIHAGEEMLRSKPLGDGTYEHNSYKSSDEVNSIKWDRLSQYAEVSEYYEGLIEFRKNHAALRMTDADMIEDAISKGYHEAEDGKFMIVFDGTKIPEEVADKIVIFFNNTANAETMCLPDNGAGTWTVCVNDEKAGIESIETFSDKATVTVAGRSAMILVQGETEDKDSVYDEINRKEKLLGYTISLDGKIGINYYMNLSAEAKEDTGAHMLFTLPDGTTTEVPISQATKETKDGKEAYVFTCKVAVKEMTKDVTGQMVFSDGTKGEAYTYSVKAYADTILADENTKDDLRTLVTDMLHYGAYAQTYFKYNTENKANKDLEAQNLANIDIGKFADYSAEALTVSGLHYDGLSLVLESETTLRVYFTLDSGHDITSYTVTCDGNPLTLWKNGKYYCVDIPNINAHNLGTKYSITISGNNQSNVLEIAALTYGHNTLKNGTAGSDLINLVKSMYLYNQAAITYLNNNNEGGI